MEFWQKNKSVNPEYVKQKKNRIESADWMDLIVQENLENEDLSYLKGKPINLNEPQGFDYQINKALKNANVLPPWIELQQEVRTRLEKLINLLEKLPEEQIEAQIEEINQKVRKYNQTCPISHLQRSLIYRDSMVQQYNKWM